MNRAEYRRQAKAAAKADKVINIKATDIAEIKRQATEQAADTAFILLLALPLIVLRDKHGFGKKRLEAFEEDLQRQYQCFSEGRITLDELRQVLFEETGMQVKTEKDYEVLKNE